MRLSCSLASWHKPALKHPPYDTMLKIGISRRKSRFVTYVCEELDDVPFAPSEALLRWWKRCNQTPEDEDLYKRTYRAALAGAGIEQVAAALLEKVADHDAAILLCHEKMGRFCHRHVFAQWWQEQTGQKIKEL